MQHIIRLFVIFALMQAYRISSTPPTSPPDENEVRRFRFRGRLSPLLRLTELLTKHGMSRVTRIVAVIVALTEAAFTIADGYRHEAWAQKILHILCQDRAGVAHAFVSVPLLVGAVGTVIGTALRIASFRTLGKQFTFLLSIKKDHELVQSGPYAFVRHPSYTAIEMVAVFYTLSLVSPGSWWMEAQAFDTLFGKVLGSMWLTAFLYKSSLLARAPLEDAMLKETFGKEWEDYAQRVKYWFIPGFL